MTEKEIINEIKRGLGISEIYLSYPADSKAITVSDREFPKEIVEYFKQSGVILLESVKTPSGKVLSLLKEAKSHDTRRRR